MPAVTKLDSGVYEVEVSIFGDPKLKVELSARGVPPKYANWEEQYVKPYEFHEVLKRAAEETLFTGNQYFAVINDGTNNMEGFPFTTYKGVMDYCHTPGLQKVRGHCSIFATRVDSGTTLKIVMFKETSTEIPLWNAKETLAELK
ncbi:MAG TPA: hypothetical protein PLM93_09320 [Sulfuricurvum sp.]|nr:hypothetical protein [Sulfuricurvum sp.]HQT36118.1 hypothetical protein [Sulfuricurvum sp.]